MYIYIYIYVHPLPSFALAAPFVVYNAEPHHVTVGTYVLSPTPSKFSIPHQVKMQDRMCGNIAVVKYIRRKRGGTEARKREQKRGRRGR